MTVKELGELLQQIEADKTVAGSELPPVEMKNVPMFQRIRMQAGERCYANQTFYREYVLTHLGGIILIGPEDRQREFAKLAEEAGKTLTFDSDVLYRDIAKSAFYMTGGKGTLGVDQLALMFSEIRLKCRTEFNIFRLRDPETDWMFSHTWHSAEALADGIRNSIFRTNGLDFTLAAIYKHVSDVSLANPIARTTIPVVFMGMKDEELPALKDVLQHGYVVVDVTDSSIVIEDEVKKTFQALKTTIKTLKENT
jgi:hypothetical protein